MSLQSLRPSFSTCKREKSWWCCYSYHLWADGWCSSSSVSCAERVGVWFSEIEQEQGVFPHFPSLDGIWSFSEVNDMRCMRGWIHPPLPFFKKIFLKKNMASWLHCAVAASAVRKGACLCDPFPPLSFSWHAASRERLEESSQDSSCSLCARDTQASKETHIYIFHLLSCCVCVPHSDISGSWYWSLFLCVLKGGKVRKLVIKIKIQPLSLVQH